MTTILAFDISSCSTGWCFFIDGEFQEDAYGIIAPSKKMSESAKLTYFRQELIRLIEKYKPDCISTENIFCGFNKVSFKVLAQFRGVALQAIYELTGKEPFSLMAVEARKVCGVGQQKEDAFEGIIEKCGLKHMKFDFDKHNDICDAICLALATHYTQNGIVVEPAAKKPKVKKRRTKRKAKTRRKGKK